MLEVCGRGIIACMCMTVTVKWNGLVYIICSSRRPGRPEEGVLMEPVSSDNIVVSLFWWRLLVLCDSTT